MERALLVGTGGFGRCWWPALEELREEFEVAAVVEPQDDERELAAKLFDLAPHNVLRPGEGDWSTLGATIAIDSSPPPYHSANAMRAFEAGMDVLVAKPMARSLSEGVAIVRAAAQAGRRIAVAQQMRYFPCFLALRQALAAGLAGRPVAARVEMALDGRGWLPGMAWRLAMDNPLLLEAGIHHLDLLRWCLSAEIEELSAVTWNPPGSPFAGDASAVAVMCTTTGVAITYDASFAPGDRPAVRFDSGWSVHCTDGVLTVSDGGLFLSDGSGSEPETLVEPTPEPVALEALNSVLLKEWLRCRAAGVASAIDGADNLRSLALVDRAIQCGVRGGHK